MRYVFCAIFLYLRFGESRLWDKGVVHYAINKKDYDLHSQDIITSTLDRLEREICVKFFNAPLNHSAANNEKILYISNPDKRKNCPPERYDYSKQVVDLAIGYKCLNERDISRLVMDMLRASIEPTVKPNSNDLLRKFQEQNADTSGNLLTPSDRNFINTHYLEECGDLVQKPVETRRLDLSNMEVNDENQEYYAPKLWPLGIVMYGYDSKASSTTELGILQQAMATIELATCVVFEQTTGKEGLEPRNLLWFGSEGEDMPQLGFMEGNQSILLPSMAYGAPGHTAHTLNLLMRVLGIPMMSNRYDRDNYVTINWRNVAKTKEHYLERLPLSAWLRNPEGEAAAYDYDSVTHAPVNYMCGEACKLGARTVKPLQDHLWQRTLSMGHRTDLSDGDIDMLKLLYNNQCQHRYRTSLNKK